ncbi:MAG: hypothetical protein J6U28_08560 [Bacteroidales bacterium]|nr:hypothetical protein [Bacteroidales bacterium]MBP5774255.1 hypothetical protein [Clostridiales bacterium]
MYKIYWEGHGPAFEEIENYFGEGFGYLQDEKYNDKFATIRDAWHRMMDALSVLDPWEVTEITITANGSTVRDPDGNVVTYTIEEVSS